MSVLQRLREAEQRLTQKAEEEHAQREKKLASHVKRVHEEARRLEEEAEEEERDEDGLSDSETESDPEAETSRPLTTDEQMEILDQHTKGAIEAEKKMFGDQALILEKLLAESRDAPVVLTRGSVQERVLFGKRRPDPSPEEKALKKERKRKRKTESKSRSVRLARLRTIRRTGEVENSDEENDVFGGTDTYVDSEASDFVEENDDDGDSDYHESEESGSDSDDDDADDVAACEVGEPGTAIYIKARVFSAFARLGKHEPKKTAITLWNQYLQWATQGARLGSEAAVLFDYGLVRADEPAAWSERPSPRAP